MFIVKDQSILITNYIVLIKQWIFTFGTS